MEPLQPPMGPQKSRKSPKVPPKGALFTPRKKRLRFHRFSDPPEPSKTSWRLHKTSIFTFWPCPQNGIKSASQNLPFRHLWAPKSPKVQKMRAQENTLKIRLQKYRKCAKMKIEIVYTLAGKRSFLPLCFQTWSPGCPRPLKYPILARKNTLF